LSGHGSGTTEDFLMKDESSMDSLTIDELTNVLHDLHLERGTTLELLGMDACYMARARSRTHCGTTWTILIAAEGLEPAFGWPYDRILQASKERQLTGPAAPAAQRPRD
jgi:hypothetical protein